MLENPVDAPSHPASKAATAIHPEAQSTPRTLGLLFGSPVIGKVRSWRHPSEPDDICRKHVKNKRSTRCHDEKSMVFHLGLSNEERLSSSDSHRFFKAYPWKIGLNRKRIAIVLPTLVPVGGAERVALSQAHEFRRLGYLIDFVFVSEPGEIAHLLPEGSRVFNLAVAKLRHSFAGLTRYFKAERPVATHVFLWPLTSIALVAHQLSGSRGRIVVSDHNNLSAQYRAKGWSAYLSIRCSTRVTYRLADARVAVSDGVARELSKLSGIPRGRFHVIHNPMPLLAPSAQDYSVVESAWKGWRGRRILTVGRLKSQKNHTLLIRAFGRLRRTVEARLMIVGSGPAEPALRQVIETEGLTEDVLVIGSVENPAAFYEKADLFVLSSDYEGFGNVLVEALAFGCPVVSTDCPSGPAEILENGKWGLLTPVGDLVALADAMSRALTAVINRSELKRRAADFSPEKAATQYLDLLSPRTSVPG